MTRALGSELPPLRANIDSPGFGRPPLWRGMPEEEREAMYAAVGEKLPLGRLGEGSDLAAADVFLICRASPLGRDWSLTAAA